MQGPPGPLRMHEEPGSFPGEPRKGGDRGLSAARTTRQAGPQRASRDAMTEASKDEITAAGTDKRRGSWKRRGCGCFAFFVGALATLVVFAPQLFGRRLVQSFVETLNESIAGEVEVGEVAFSWTGVQRLRGMRLRDPEGRTVAEFDIEVPSIGTLISAASRVDQGRAGDYGKIFGSAELALVTGPGVPSNLERALADSTTRATTSKTTSSGSSTQTTSTEVQVEVDDDEGDRELTIAVDSNLRFAKLEIEFQVKHFSWTDPRFDDGRRAIGVKGLTAQLLFEPEQPARFKVSGEHIYGDQHGPLAIDAIFDVGGLFDGSDWFHVARGRIEIDALPTAVFDRYLDLSGDLLTALGPQFDVHLQLGQSGDRGQRLTAALTSILQNVQLDARLEDGLMHIAEDAPTSLNLRIPAMLLEKALGESWPKGASLANAGGLIPVDVEVSRLAFPLSDDADWQSVELGLRVDLPELDVDILDAESIALRNSMLSVVATPNGPLQAELTVHEAGGGDLRVVLQLPPAWQAQVAGDAGLATLDYRTHLSLSGLPPQRVANWAALDPQVADLFKEVIELDLHAQPSATGDLLVNLELASGGNQVRSSATIGEDFIELETGKTLVTLAATTEQLVALIGESWPAEFELRSETGRVRSQLFVHSARWPLDGGMGTATLEARVGSLELTNPTLRDAQQRIALRELRVNTALEAAKALEIDVRLDLADGDGAADLQLRSQERLSEVFDSAEPTWFLALNSAGLRTDLIDVLAEQDGLLVDVFGPTLKLKVDVQDWNAGSARVQAQLDSSNASITWSGHLADNVLQSSGETESLDARVGITPLFQERIVGNLLPVLVGVQAVDGADPASLQVTNFSMPLSAPERSVLAGLQADIRLDLGRVRCAVLPELAGLLSSQVHQLRPTELPILSLKIRDGVVLMDSFPIEIEKTPIHLAGNFALVDERMNFTCSVPLSGLRGDVGKVLNDARKYLDPALAVPLTIHGQPSRPQVGVEGNFLKQVVKDGAGKAAEDALQKAAGDALRKLFGND